MTEDLRNLPPEERIKKLKELEKKRKKEIEEAKKGIKESETELTERRNWFEKVPIPQIAQDNLAGLGVEGKKILETHKGIKEKKESVDEVVTESSDKEMDLEELAQERVDVPFELMQSEYAQHLSQKPVQELYGEMKNLQENVAEKGYVTAEEQRKAEYLIAGMENKLEDVEEGSYSFTEKAAMRASLIQQMGAKVTGMYKSGQSMYKS
jgi:hypothetical protein